MWAWYKVSANLGDPHELGCCWFWCVYIFSALEWYTVLAKVRFRLVLAQRLPHPFWGLHAYCVLCVYVCAGVL